MTNNLTLWEVLEELIQLKIIAPSRIPPIKSTLRKVARFLGFSSPQTCSPSAYNLPGPKIAALIDRQMVTHALSSHAVRNIKNDFSYVLVQGRLAGLIDPLPPEVEEGEVWAWKEIGKIPVSGERYYSPPQPPIQLSKQFEEEMTEYRKFCTGHDERCPRNLKRRTITMDHAEAVLRLLARYLHHQQGLAIQDITLRSLSNPTYAKAYFADYLAPRENKVTAGLFATASLIRALLLYQIIVCPVKKAPSLQKDLQELRRYLSCLPPRTPSLDKEKRMTTLKTLDKIGRSYYASVDPALKAIPLDQLVPLVGAKTAASRMTVALLIRLTVRIPMRQRNLREMRWCPENPANGRNLFQKDGRWFVRFQGEELKIAHRKNGKDGLNLYTHEVPPELSKLLNEYLSIWRSVLVAHQRKAACGKEKISDQAGRATGQEYVFLSALGQPFTTHLLCRKFVNASYRFLGKTINPHMYRTIWATEYIIRTKDFVGAAYMLGDKVETVLAHYAHLLDERIKTEVDGFMADALDLK